MRYILVLLVALAIPACQQSMVAVKTQEQALALVQAYERDYLRKLHGRDENLPLVSLSPPYAVIESENLYKFVFRSAAPTSDGGYIRVFNVNQQTGSVSRGEWTGK